MTLVTIPHRPSRRLARALDMMFSELWKPPGLAAGLCTESSLQWRFCIGERQVGSGLPIDERTVFALASGTKTMATATVAQLCDRHVLDWDTPVASIDPAFDAGDPRVTHAITLRDLACHRSGWTSSEGRHRAAATSRADLVSRLRYHGFRHAFRERFAYCTDGFSLLGHIVDMVAKQSWEQYAQANLLAPLGMRNTSFTVHEAQVSGNFAAPHLLTPEGSRVAIPWQYEDGVATPAGGANSCLADLGRWLGAWLADSDAAPWSVKQRRLMLEPQILNSGPFADLEFSCAVATGDHGITAKAYALGWYCHRYRGELVYHHTGSIRGFRSLIAALPERKLGFIALVNADAVFLPRALFQAVLDDLQGSDPTTWTARFFDLEAAWHRANVKRYRRVTSWQVNHDLSDLPGVYRDDGRFGSVRITSHKREFALEAGSLRYRLLPLNDAVLECYERCGPLCIYHDSLHVHRNALGAIVDLSFQDAIFRRL